jgi:hypothetical protein
VWTCRQIPKIRRNVLPPSSELEIEFLRNVGICQVALQPIRHPDISVKHVSIRGFTSIPFTLYADVFIYKTESCSKTLFRRN